MAKIDVSSYADIERLSALADDVAAGNKPWERDDQQGVPQTVTDAVGANIPLDFCPMWSDEYTVSSVEMSLHRRAMKVKDVPRRNAKGRTRARTLEYLESHADEVFRIRQCSQIAEALGVPQRTVEHALWSLQRDGLISKDRLDGVIWYGSRAAIDALLSLRPDAVRL